MPIRYSPGPEDRPEPVQPTEFPTLNAFYFDDFTRYASGEADYGVMWRDGLVNWPHWRVSYIRATGEVYGLELGGYGRVRILGVIPADEPPDGGNFRPYSTWHHTLDRLLGNWADPELTRNFSLSWITERIRGVQGFTACPGRDCPAGYAMGDPPLCHTVGRCMRPAEARHERGDT